MSMIAEYAPPACTSLMSLMFWAQTVGTPLTRDPATAVAVATAPFSSWRRVILRPPIALFDIGTSLHIVQFEPATVLMCTSSAERPVGRQTLGSAPHVCQYPVSSPYRPRLIPTTGLAGAAPRGRRALTTGARRRYPPPSPWLYPDRASRSASTPAARLPTRRHERGHGRGRRRFPGEGARMKPAAFEYVAVRTTEEALAELARDGQDARLLAGGQSLMPILNMRLATPRRLIDLNRVGELAYIRAHDGGVAIGAMTRQRAVEKSALVARCVPLLADATPCVGHFQIRNPGTIRGGPPPSPPGPPVAPVAACLDARVTVRGPAGTRTLTADQLYWTYLTTTLAPTEILTEVWFPTAPSRTGHAWLEFARRHGDYALVGVAAAIMLEEDSGAEARPAPTA